MSKKIEVEEPVAIQDKAKLIEMTTNSLKSPATQPKEIEYIPETTGDILRVVVASMPESDFQAFKSSQKGYDQRDCIDILFNGLARATASTIDYQPNSVWNEAGDKIKACMDFRGSRIPEIVLTLQDAGIEVKGADKISKKLAASLN